MSISNDENQKANFLNNYLFPFLLTCYKNLEIIDICTEISLQREIHLFLSTDLDTTQYPHGP